MNLTDRSAWPFVDILEDRSEELGIRPLPHVGALQRVGLMHSLAS